MSFEEVKIKIEENVDNKISYISNNNKDVKDELKKEYSLIASNIFENERPKIEKSINDVENIIGEIVHNIVRLVSTKYLVKKISQELLPNETISRHIENILFDNKNYKILYNVNMTYTEIINNLRYEYKIYHKRMMTFLGKNPLKKIYIILFYVFIPIFWVQGIIKLIKIAKDKRKRKERLKSNDFEILLRSILYSEKYTNTFNNSKYM